MRPLVHILLLSSTLSHPKYHFSNDRQLICDNVGIHMAPAFSLFHARVCLLKEELPLKAPSEVSSCSFAPSFWLTCTHICIGAYTIHDTEGTPELILVGTGTEVSLCTEAAAKLAPRKVRTPAPFFSFLFQMEDGALFPTGFWVWFLINFPPRVHPII